MPINYSPSRQAASPEIISATIVRLSGLTPPDGGWIRANWDAATGHLLVTMLGTMWAVNPHQARSLECTWDVIKISPDWYDRGWSPSYLLRGLTREWHHKIWRALNP